MANISLRFASSSDRELVSALMTGAELRHVHLDWVPVLDLIEDPLFLIASRNDLPQACLAAPPDPTPLAWIRLFAVANKSRLDPLWDSLWVKLQKAAASQGVELIYSLALHPWFEPLLMRSGFEQSNEVIFYEWSGSAGVLERDRSLSIRRIKSSDLPQIAEIDHDAFAPAWQNSLRTLSTARKLSTYATVSEVAGVPVGYQISTASALGAHLARLAVREDYQHRGIGRALVVDMLKHVNRRGFDRVTVNTQADNLNSQHLYNSLGFEPTGQRYRMYACSIRSG
jgi:ribosomal protein S18 acetylase RimI-like enzyme